MLKILKIAARVWLDISTARALDACSTNGEVSEKDAQALHLCTMSIFAAIFLLFHFCLLQHITQPPTL